jgi:TatD DNase family protein
VGIVEMFDTHSHIYSEEFDADRDEAIQRAKNKGVSGIILPNVDAESIDRLLQTEEKYRGYCYAAMGLHPTSVNAEYKKQLLEIEKQLQQRPFVAIGEIGIDLYWDKTFLKEQISAFEQQIEWALDYKYPVIIHSREAHNEIMSSLKKHKNKGLTGVFHSFSGNLEQAKEILAFGNFKLGINGVITFKNSGLDKIIANLQPSDLVLETDSPYLTPVPFRGKRNESSYITFVVKKLAEIFQIPEEEIKKITLSTTKTIFPSIFL